MHEHYDSAFRYETTFDRGCKLRRRFLTDKQAYSFAFIRWHGRDVWDESIDRLESMLSRGRSAREQTECHQPRNKSVLPGPGWICFHVFPSVVGLMDCDEK